MRSELINRERRRLLGGAAMAIATTGLFNRTAASAAEPDAFRPFRVDVPDEDLIDLRRRLVATRWPDRETVTDNSQGVPLSMLQELVRYWCTGYSWRRVERRLNSLTQFVTAIDGVDIHFIHVRSQHEKARCR